MIVEKRPNGFDPLGRFVFGLDVKMALQVGGVLEHAVRLP
jgi:hypothetical protein